MPHPPKVLTSKTKKKTYSGSVHNLRHGNLILWLKAFNLRGNAAGGTSVNTMILLLKKVQCSIYKKIFYSFRPQ
jgi:hypothetical protein